VEYLVKEGAIVSIADIDIEKAKKLAVRFNLSILDPKEIVTSDCEVFAPCALGAVINDMTLSKLKCKIVAGGANNQLAEYRHGDALMEMGVLYAPDYVINAGGLMNVFVELEGYSSDRAFEKTNQVFENLIHVFHIAKTDNIATHRAADRLAESRIRRIGELRQHHHGRTSRPFSTLKEMTSRQK
ncbi:MAG: leucine dehydrogenase, partial [Bdellovibrionales bacterium]|nr:leucine dehydrogenase [Bdellovibrionales bacterium]